jgi:hypothetical protein
LCVRVCVHACACVRACVRGCAARLLKATVQLYLLEALSAKGRITKCGETM